MGHENSIEYYTTRERNARPLPATAASPASPAIAVIHGEMADRYLALVNDASIASSPRLRRHTATTAH